MLREFVPHRDAVHQVEEAVYHHDVRNPLDNVSTDMGKERVLLAVEM